MNDPQKRRIYKWEIFHGWDKNATTFEECVKWINKACKIQIPKIKPPQIQSHSGDLSWSWPEYDTISMRTDGELNIPIALHEATHHIVFHQRRYTVQDHGHYFFATYLGLLDRANILTPAILRDTAKEHGIKWSNA